ncbi:MAG: T9SS type A sorting domain-containing protein [Bacteroidia bacterium]|nr:T9SS type A sorting domain-containing protein [Bacteroidia bacterium]
MKPLSILLILGCIGLHHATAQVNYSEDIAPIIYNNCTSCHRPGEIAPFSLTNYNEVAAWGTMLKYVTEIKYMPPWKPDRNYSTFVGEKGLTEQEIKLIAEWVDAGTPQGDPNLEPPLPNFPTGSQLGTPDLVLEMSEDYFIEGNNQDDYRVFVLPTGLAEDKEIAAIEFRPGNTRAVHHALLAYETDGLAAARDAQSATYGYESFGDFGVPVQGTFTGYTPGIQSVFFPEGIGTTLPKGSDLLVQVHYAPLATNETDRSKVNIFYKKGNDSISREVERLPATPFDLDGGFLSFNIAPNTVRTFHGTKELTEDISLMSVYPHMHYLGKKWDLYALTPSGDTINIVRINDWDFNWQGAYTFDRMKKIPSGSVIHVWGTYDNTSNNPFNPNNPPARVRWGESTTDEMYLVGMTYVPYRNGDENIVMGQGTTTHIEDVFNSTESRIYLPFPNPANDYVVMSYYLDKPQTINIEILDSKGALVKSIVKEQRFTTGNHKLEFEVNELPAGLYTLSLNNTSLKLTRPLVITK